MGELRPHPTNLTTEGRRTQRDCNTIPYPPSPIGWGVPEVGKST